MPDIEKLVAFANSLLRPPAPRGRPPGSVSALRLAFECAVAELGVKAARKDLVNWIAAEKPSVLRHNRARGYQVRQGRGWRKIADKTLDNAAWKARRRAKRVSQKT